LNPFPEELNELDPPYSSINSKKQGASLKVSKTDNCDRKGTLVKHSEMLKSCTLQQRDDE